MARQREKYGCYWSDDLLDIQIELSAIRKGGRWKLYPKDEREYGMGLSYHFDQARAILWPWIDTHRWHTLCRDAILNNKIAVLMGPGSSGKTSSAAWIYLLDYYSQPDTTCVLVSSTDMRGLELRVWGEIKMLHEQAQEQFPDKDIIPGYLIDSRKAICTDNIDEEKARDLRKGIIGIPCVQSGKYVGLGKYCGIKQKRVKLLADEAQFMGEHFLNAFANFNQNADFTACVMGNPNDILDPLGKAAEPIDGWSAHLEPTKTDTWKTRFMGGICVNLVGTDSPNFDFPENEPTRYKYLISREKIQNTLSFFPKDSTEYLSQCVGVMKLGTMERRVITRDLCTQFGARDPAVWSGAPRTKIFALDAAYGGDRCVGGHIEFGKDVNGDTVIDIKPPMIIPVIVKMDEQPEDQIAQWVKDYIDTNEIPPENIFHDSTGRGGLGTALARIISDQCNPVEFGGPPTNRQVSLDLFVYDTKERRRRPKLCNEHYDRFVTELWWTVRLAIESRQLKNLPEDVMEEMCMRMYDKVKEYKYKIETKVDMKKRVGRSPDLGDWLSIACEGARRRGFHIKKLGNMEEGGQTDWSWLEALKDKANAARKNHELLRV